MVSITNNGNDPLAFVVGKEKDGSPKTETLAPGETKDIEVLGGKDNPVVRGRAAAGLITLGRVRSTAAETPAAKK